MKNLPTLALIVWTIMTAATVQAADAQMLPPCPQSPNCVSSQATATDQEHFIAPFRIKGDPILAWSTLQKAIIEPSRTHITQVDASRLRAEASSLIFRFTDDIEAILDPKANIIHIRSASRVGYSDFGVNRKRLEALRLVLQTAEVIKAPNEK